MQRTQTPPATLRRRRKLEHRAPAKTSAKKRSPINVSGLVENQTVHRIRAIAVRKNVEHSLGPTSTLRRTQLEDCAIQRRTAPKSRAIEVAHLVEDQSGRRKGAVIAGLEVINHGLRPVSVGRRFQLEYGSAPAGAGPRAAVRSSAVKISRGVGHQPGRGIRPVAAASKTIEHFLGGRIRRHTASEHQSGNNNEDRRRMIHVE
jgi:hypothetical protein